MERCNKGADLGAVARRCLRVREGEIGVDGRRDGGAAIELGADEKGRIDGYEVAC